jgi:hypothetical protein
LCEGFNKYAISFSVAIVERGELVKRAFEEFATGRFTKEQVLDKVTRLGLRTRTGRKLNPQSFGRNARQLEPDRQLAQADREPAAGGLSTCRSVSEAVQ